MCVLALHFRCTANINEEVFIIDSKRLILELFLFILGIYGTRIFDYLYTWVQKRDIQLLIFYVVLFILIHILLNSGL